MNCLRWIVAALAVLLIGTGCGKKNEPEPGKGKTEQRLFIVNGIVKRVEPEVKTIRIQHEDIPNFMPAMTMAFDVKDPKLIAGFKPEDHVRFRLVVTENESWIDQIEKSLVTLTNQLPATGSFRLVRDVEPLEVGDLMPDYQFTNELGRPVKFRDYQGQALALTFIFTRCPLPEFCPLMSRNFAEVHRQLSANPKAPTNWHLISFSFDPEFDTPAILKIYAEQLDYRPEKWSFWTGALIDVDAMTEQFGLEIFRRGADVDHKLRTVIVNPAGRIRKIIMGNSWKPEEVVAELLQALAGDKPEK